LKKAVEKCIAGGLGSGGIENEEVEGVKVGVNVRNGNPHTPTIYGFKQNREAKRCIKRDEAAMAGPATLRSLKLCSDHILHRARWKESILESEEVEA